MKNSFTMIQFVNITEKEFLKHKLLYKHMPLENALRSLNEKYFWFANPSSWKDPFEKRFLEAKYIMNGKEVNFNWKNKVFCTCLTQTLTSEAYWNIYKHNNIGIEFRIYRKKLLEELKNLDGTYKIFIGRAEYLKTSEIKRDLREIPFSPPIAANIKINSDTFASRLFLLKRIAFKYEDEIRIIIVKKNPTKEVGIKVNYKCNNTDIIHQIVLDPNLGENTSLMLKKVLADEYGFIPIVGKDNETHRVLQSQLYARQSVAELHID